MSKVIGPEYVRLRVADIAASAGNFESAHDQEDSLYRAVLRAIADGTCEKPRQCAALALSSQEIEFTRYCA